MNVDDEVCLCRCAFGMAISILIYTRTLTQNLIRYGSNMPVQALTQLSSFTVTHSTLTNTQTHNRTRTGTHNKGTHTHTHT